MGGGPGRAGKGGDGGAPESSVGAILGSLKNLTTGRATKGALVHFWARGEMPESSVGATKGALFGLP